MSVAPGVNQTAGSGSGGPGAQQGGPAGQAPAQTPGLTTQGQGPVQGQGQGQEQRDLSIPVPVHFDGHNINIITEFTNSSLPKPKDRLSLYKTELCREWTIHNYCFYGKRCSFAHGVSELRPVFRSKKWRTKKCRNWSTTGWCNYAHRCQFLHDEPAPRRDARGGGQDSNDRGSPQRSDSEDTFARPEGRTRNHTHRQMDRHRNARAAARVNNMPELPPRAGRHIEEQDTKIDSFEAGAGTPAGRPTGARDRRRRLEAGAAPGVAGSATARPEDVVAAAAAAAAGQRVRPGLYAKGYDTGYAEGFKMAQQQLQKQQHSMNSPFGNPSHSNSQSPAMGLNPVRAPGVATANDQVKASNVPADVRSAAMSQLGGAKNAFPFPNAGTQPQPAPLGRAPTAEQKVQEQQILQQAIQQQQAMQQQQQQLGALNLGALQGAGIPNIRLPAATPAAIAAAGPTASPPGDSLAALGLGFGMLQGLTPRASDAQDMAGFLGRTPSVPMNIPRAPSVGTDVSTPRDWPSAPNRNAELNNACAYLKSLGINPMSRTELEFLTQNMEKSGLTMQNKQPSSQVSTPAGAGPVPTPSRNAFGALGELNLPGMSPSVPLEGMDFMSFPGGAFPMPSPSPPPFGFQGFPALDSVANAPPTPQTMSFLQSSGLLNSQVNLPPAVSTGGAADAMTQMNNFAMLSSLYHQAMPVGGDLALLQMMASVGNQSTCSNNKFGQGVVFDSMNGAGLQTQEAKKVPSGDLQDQVARLNLGVAGASATDAAPVANGVHGSMKDEVKQEALAPLGKEATVSFESLVTQKQS